MTTIEQESLQKLRRLDFVVIGAQKSATSWMYYCLKDHPEICVPAKKLEAGYIGGEMYKEKGVEWFFDRFLCSCKKIRGDVSVEYLYDSSTAEALAPFLFEKSRFLLSLRNPVDRMVSGYYWLVRRGKLENLPLEKGLVPILDQPAGFPVQLDGPLEEVVRRSCYGPQLDVFLDKYGEHRFFVVLYEDIASDRLNTIQQVYEYLGVDSTFQPPSIGLEPKRNSYKSWLLAVENRFSNSKYVAKLADYANRLFFRFYGGAVSSGLNAGLREKLNRLFAPVVDEAIHSIGRLPSLQRPDLNHLRKTWGQ